MEFRNAQTIYLQIVDFFQQNIVKGTWVVHEKVPSVRQLAVELEVNPNTVMRAYTQLQDQGVIYNKRGVGFFVSEDARKIVLKHLRDSFINDELPKVFNALDHLDITLEEIEQLFQKWKQNKSNQ
jgi:DNA-binding transcriptional regulator YhcF (GntR family)